MNPKQGKGAPKPQNKGPSQGGASEDNPTKLQEKKNTTKAKKDTGKWCEFHNNSTQNTIDCRAKQSLVVEMKAFEWDTGSGSKSEPDKGTNKSKQIIDVDPSATMSTRNI